MAKLSWQSRFKSFSPKEFMRGRRPELFSDSKYLAEPLISREQFEYFLNTLTSRKQENEFEHFCRRLAEKELCPNLLPQTGPSGGGDSKVDAETYPVADEIAARWYEGIVQKVAQERWAFAFSAKKDWRSKVQSDVDKIVSTGRNYKFIYFITNQFVKDKSRAEIEDSLNKNYDLNVRILDRNWIVKCVFEHGRIQIAIDTLNLTGHKEVINKRLGPRDTERDAELRELEELIEEPNRYSRVEYQLVEDCLQAALLARGLELPRVEIEGRFSRAERLAEKYGKRQQRLRVAYEKAWTVYWWYEDLSELNTLYNRVEELSICSECSNDLELLTNLWQLLNATTKMGLIDPIEAKITERTEALKAELDRLAKDETRPSNALTARTNRVLMELYDAVNNYERFEGVIFEIREIIKLGDGCINFPVDEMTKIIIEFGKAVPESDKFDELFEFALKVLERRTSEGMAGRMLMERGYQKLTAGLKYEAISLLGRAQPKLAKHEYRRELFNTLVFCSMAYERAGLLWAARINILTAANQALHEFWRHGKISPQALFCLQRLVWIELQLGRVTCALSWIELTDIVSRHLFLDEQQKNRFIDQRELQDAVLGLLFLKADFIEIKWLEKFPDILEHLGLFFTRIALLYVLGYEDQLRIEHFLPKNEDDLAIKNFFMRWLNQPANDDLPDKPEFFRGKTVLLRSFVLGCEIKLVAENILSSVYLAEAILTALESLLATSLNTHLLPYRSELGVSVKSSDFIQTFPQYKIREINGDPRIEVLHPPEIRYGSLEEQQAFRSWLLEVVLVITEQIALSDDLIKYFDKLASAEAGFDRALNFTIPSVFVTNMLGDKPKIRISDWVSEGMKEFPLKRNVCWTDSIPKTHGAPEKKASISYQSGEGEPPDELLGVENLKHRDRKIVSLINIPLWDKAKWSGTAYIFHPHPLAPPVLSLVFQEIESGKLIYKSWRGKFGPIDTYEQLRITIIKGIDKASPASYKIVVGANIKIHSREPNFKHAILTARINRMDPRDSTNLDNFLQQFHQKRRYMIAPAHSRGPTIMPDVFFELGIGKYELHIKQAWEIGQNDMEMVAITEGDDPIIPDDIKNPPVQEVLENLKKWRRRWSY
ncbi:MAG: hypothetical protein ACOZF2_06940 [Thermodesulfobacteriota bacterium]